MQRRQFFYAAATAGAAAPLLTGAAAGAEPGKGPPPLLRFDAANEVVRGDMRYRKLGSTGVEVSCVGVGGFHIGVPKDEAESIKIMRTALDAGMNFLDNCWDTMTGSASCGWARRFRTATARRRS